MSASIARLPSPAAVALERGRDYLLGLQNADGYWKAELETNVTMDAEDLLLRQFLGIGDAETLRRTAAWIRSQQGAEGGWANFYGGPPDLSATIEAYAALRLAGDPADAEHMRRAAGVVQRARRHRALARLHAHLARALRPVVLGRGCRRCRPR